MTVDIAAQVTGTWPITENTLLDDVTAGYAAQKVRAIARAESDLYGSVTPPADIPDRAAYWISDRAVLYLIPVARDYYMSKQRLSDSKEGATISYYDKLRALDGLKAELEAATAVNLAEAQEAISATDEAADDTPAVSTAGLLVDPALRAYHRGVPGRTISQKWWR